MMPPIEKVAGRPIRQVKHKYEIKSINLKSWNGSVWEDYHPFEAVVEKMNAVKSQIYLGRNGRKQLISTTVFVY